MPDRLKIGSSAAVAFLALWLVAPASVAATHRGEGVVDEVSLQMSYQQPSVTGGHGSVVARAIVDDGSPVIGVEVEFLREVDFLGARLISMGRANTDASGTARVAIDTNELTIRVRARLRGDEHYAPAEVSLDIHQLVAPGGPVTDEGTAAVEPRLTAIATVMPLLLAAIALATCLSLLGLTATTVLAIRRGRPSVSLRREGRT